MKGKTPEYYQVSKRQLEKWLGQISEEICNSQKLNVRMEYKMGFADGMKLAEKLFLRLRLARILGEEDLVKVREKNANRNQRNDKRRCSTPNLSYTKDRKWGALRKAWKAYRISKVQKNQEEMKKYATQIRKLQDELGISKADFPDLGIV